MSREPQRAPITQKTIAYHTPTMNEVTVDRDLIFDETDTHALTMDIYYPPKKQEQAPLPAVILVTGFPDPGFQARMGCRQKEMESYISWAKAIASCGLAAVTYANKKPAEDIHSLLQHLEDQASSLGIDPNHLGLWSCSSNVPNALSVLMQHRDALKCAVLCYGFMLDLDGSTHIAQAAEQWGFVNPCSGKSLDDLPGNLPLFIARAGQDEIAHLNTMLDRFMAKALDRNLPVSLVNHQEGPHAFDLMHDSETTCQIIRQILAFLCFQLLGTDKPGS